MVSLWRLKISPLSGIEQYQFSLQIAQICKESSCGIDNTRPCDSEMLTMRKQGSSIRYETTHLPPEHNPIRVYRCACVLVSRSVPYSPIVFLYKYPYGWDNCGLRNAPDQFSCSHSDTFHLVFAQVAVTRDPDPPSLSPTRRSIVSRRHFSCFIFFLLLFILAICFCELRGLDRSEARFVVHSTNCCLFCPVLGTCNFILVHMTS